MTYSYQYPVTNTMQNTYYDNTNSLTNQRTSAIPLTLTGAAIGTTGGAVVGCFKKEKITNNKGILKDEFVKRVHKKILEHNNELDNFNEKNEFLIKLKKIKNVDDLKNLVNEYSNIELKTKIANINNNNLKKTIETITQEIDASNNAKHTNIKNDIYTCWDNKEKKFIKPDTVEEDIFNIIKKSRKTISLKNIGKFALIGAAITGGISYIAGKLLIK